MNRQLASIILILLLTATYASADTFMHRSTRQILHGYPTGQKQNGKTVLHTQEKGKIAVNIAEYSAKQDNAGRNNTVAVISISEQISLEMETDAFETAIVEEASKGPLFILIEIDTPGGRVDLTMRLCNAISKIRHCKTVAFIKGGKHGGAYSAGVAIALSCDRIYMAHNTAIGASTVIGQSSTGLHMDLEKVIGEDYSEKIRAAWRNYLASLAQRNNRPALLAKAMENKDMEVMEVLRQNRRIFIEPINKRSTDKNPHVWSPKGSLLTLPAKDAEVSGFIDKTVISRDQLLADLKATNAEIINNTKTDDARDLYRRLSAKVDKIYNSHNARIKRVEQIRNRLQSLKLMKEIIRDLKYVIKLKKEYPDIEVDDDNLQDVLSSVEADYENLKTMYRTR